MRAVAAVLGACLALVATAARADELQVTVESGALVGLASRDGAVRSFKGVPYAAPPVEGLRWRPPQPAAKWQGVREAMRFAPVCPQPSPPPGGFYQREYFQAAEPQSEDCIYLNVWTPTPAGSAAARPVMVFFHGGGFVRWSGSMPVFDGSQLARKGVVVVTLNFRLGPFGFLTHPQLDAESPNNVSGNYGLLDQLAALRWVQTNIAAFGGDPARVTIFGQSAGATSVAYAMASPQAKGLFGRAIALGLIGFCGASLMSDFGACGRV
jgi:para-nitrobenzyl esterase